MLLSVKTKRLCYEITFHGKYSIIRGDSGIGKTTLSRLLLRAELQKQAVRVECNLQVVTISATADEDVLQKHSNTVFVIDENCLLLRQSNIARILKESNNYFIIITRKQLGYLPISVDSFYSLLTVGDVTRNVPMYPRFNHDYFGEVDLIITEDSCSSYYYFKRYFTIPVTSSGAKSKVALTLKREYEVGKKFLIVYDAAAFSTEIEDLVKYISSRANVKVLDWESFEHYVLQSKLFGINLTLDDAGCHYESLEQLATEKLSEIIPYSKSQLSKCLLPESVCGNCKSVDQCEWKHAKEECTCLIHGALTTLRGRPDIMHLELFNE